MLWLPAQGAAVAALSVCVQEKSINSQHDQSTMTVDNHHHDDCHKQTANSATDHVLASLPCSDASCDASSNTPILPDHTAPVLTTDTSIITALNSGFISFVPEQPQRPPLTASL